MENERLDILLVEDNPGDVHLTLEALRVAGTDHHVQVVSDGEAAIRLLTAARPGETVRPDLILLDLNLPRRNGHEVLAAVRRDETTRDIPVVVLTSSERTDDINESYDLRANCYVTKPADAGQFMSAVQSLCAYWTRQLRAGPSQIP